jgi:Beta-lactamase
MATDDIDAVLNEAASSGRVPGVVALAAGRDGPIHQGVFGKCSLTDGISMAQDIVFWIASMTKAINLVAAMQCVARPYQHQARAQVGGAPAASPGAGCSTAGPEAAHHWHADDTGGGPFADPTVLQLLDDFETAVYRTMMERTSHG